MKAPRNPVAPEEVQRLLDTISALRDEIAGLRTARQLRAIIEQAKGALMERHGIGPDEAFDRLRRLSQQHNVRLVEVAATVVGGVIPASGPALDAVEETLRDVLPHSVSASAVWQALQEQPDVRAGVAQALLGAVATGTSQGDEAARLLIDLTAGHGVDAITLYRRAADESLRLVGQTGMSGDVVSSWRHIPPTPDIPYVAAVQDARAYFWASKADRDRDFPAVAKVPSPYSATALIPISDDGRVVGVAGLMWRTAPQLTDEQIDWIGDLVQRVGAMLLRSAGAVDPELEWQAAVLALVFDPWLVLDGIARSQGPVRDFVIADAAPVVPNREELLGRRLLEVWPLLDGDGTAAAFSALITSGGGWTASIGEASDMPWGIPGTQLRAVRLGRKIVLVWRQVPPVP